MARTPPPIITEVGFDFHWVEEKVWALDIPVEDMPLADLEWHFDIPFWWTEGGFYDFKPIWALQNPDQYPQRIQRIMSANLDYPLDIMHWRGRWLLLDGLHRLAKSKLLGHKTVKVRKIPQSAIPAIQK